MTSLAIGLIQRLVPAAELEQTTYDYLKVIAANAPLSVRGSKVTIQAYLGGSTTSIAPAARARTRGLGERGLPGRHARLPREAPAHVPGAVGPGACASSSSAPHRPAPSKAAEHWSAIDGSSAASRGSGTPGERRAARPCAPASTRSTAGSTTPALALRRRRRRPRGRGRSRRVHLGRPAAEARFVAALKGIIADELKNERGHGARAPGSASALGARQHRAGGPRRVPSRYSRGRGRTRSTACRRPPGRRAGADRPRGMAAPVRRAPRRLRPGRPTCWRWRACIRASVSTTCCAAAGLLRDRIPAVRIRIVGRGAGVGSPARAAR